MQCNECEGKEIIKVLIETADNNTVSGFICISKDYEEDEFLELYIDDEEIVVYTLFKPNTGVAAQAGYETQVLNKKDIVSITRNSDVEPDITPCV